MPLMQISKKQSKYIGVIMKSKLLILLSLTLLILLTGCSHKSSEITPSDDVQDPSTYWKLFEDKKHFRSIQQKNFFFDRGRFALYDDVDLAPIDYGRVVIKNKKFCLKGAKKVSCYDIKQHDNGIELKNDKESRLIYALDSVPDYYKPQNLFDVAKFGTKEDLEAISTKDSYEYVNDVGSYPLIEAVATENYPLIVAMIEDGANLFSQNFSGYTALHTALQMRDKKIVKLLLANGAQTQFRPCGEFLDVLLEDDTFEMGKIMIEAGFNPSCQQSAFLFWALGLAKPKSYEIVEFLLEHHIKTDAFSLELGDTPLMRAAATADDRLVKMLLDYGVNVQSTDYYGQTALDYDSKYLKKKNPKIAPLLHRAGLTKGIVVTKNNNFKKAQKLFKNRAYKMAYKAFVEHFNTYQERRFLEGALKAYQAISKPSIETTKEMMGLFAQLNLKRDKNFYEKMIGFYENMYAHARDDDRLTSLGDYKEDSIYFVTFKIDKLYDLMIEHKPSMELYAKKLKNLQKIKAYANFKRIDIQKNGMRYVGEGLFGKAFGKGAIGYENGDKYIGTVIDFIRHGKGKLTLKNGRIFDGDWVNDKRHGKLFFTNETNAMYLGTFENDRLVGVPVLVRKGR